MGDKARHAGARREGALCAVALSLVMVGCGGSSGGSGGGDTGNTVQGNVVDDFVVEADVAIKRAADGKTLKTVKTGKKGRFEAQVSTDEPVVIEVSGGVEDPDGDPTTTAGQAEIDQTLMGMADPQESGSVVVSALTTGAEEHSGGDFGEYEKTVSDMPDSVSGLVELDEGEEIEEVAGKLSSVHEIAGASKIKDEIADDGKLNGSQGVESKAVTTVAAQNKEGVSFDDSILEACVRDEIGVASSEKITRAQAEKITRLSCQGGGISSLEGIAALKNLKFLDVSDNEIRSLEPITGLENLKGGDFWGNRIQRLSPLSEARFTGAAFVVGRNCLPEGVTEPGDHRFVQLGFQKERCNALSSYIDYFDSELTDAPQKVRFRYVAKSLPDGQMTLRFGDGTEQSIGNAIATRTVTHEYESEGVKTAKLVVDDAIGQSLSTEVLVRSKDDAYPNASEYNSDIDGDGLADAWEWRYFGDLSSNAASDDPDGDGRSNLEEFYGVGTASPEFEAGDDGLAVSNPNVVDLTKPSVEVAASSNTLDLAWDAARNLAYNVYISTDSDCDIANYTLCSNSQMFANVSGGNLTIDGLTNGVTHYVVVEVERGETTQSVVTDVVEGVPVAQTVSAGDTKWTFDLDGKPSKVPAVAKDGTVYVGSRDGNVYALNADGSQKWRFEASGPIGTASPSVGPGGAIYIGDKNGKYYALDPDGTKRWVNTIGGKVRDSALFVNSSGDLRITAVAEGDDTLYALSESGSQLWSYSNGDIDRGLVVQEANAVYAGSWLGPVSLGPSTGGESWTAGTGEGGKLSLSGSGEIYHVNQGKLFSLASGSGDIQWTYNPDNTLTGSAVVGPNSKIYVPSVEGVVYAVGSDGAQQWSLNIGAHINFSVIGDNGVLYMAAKDGYLYAIGKDGTQKWRSSLSGAYRYAPIIGPNGTLYIGTDDGILHAIETDATGLNGTAAWPALLHDRMNTANSALGP